MRLRHDDHGRDGEDDAEVGEDHALELVDHVVPDEGNDDLDNDDDDERHREG